MDFVILSQPFTRTPNTPSTKKLQKYNGLMVTLLDYMARVSCYLPADNKRQTKDYSAIVMLLGTYCFMLLPLLINSGDGDVSTLVEILFNIDTSLPGLFANIVAAGGICRVVILSGLTCYRAWALFDAVC